MRYEWWKKVPAAADALLELDPRYYANVAETKYRSLVHLELALGAVTRAQEMSGGRDWSILDTMARTQYLLGNLDDAVTWQGKAVEEVWSHSQRKALKTRPDQYIKGKRAELEKPLSGITKP